MEELVEVLRKLWRLHEGPVHHEGPFYRVHVEPTSDTAPPVQDHLPIWTAGVNPRMIRAAGRVADGLVGHPMFTASYVDAVVRPALETGARSVGRDAKEITVMGILMCAVDDDVEAARRRIAYAISQYAASRVYDRLFAVHGWQEAQLEIRAAAKRRDIEALVRAVPDEAIDAIGVACRPGELAAAVAVHATTYDHLDLVAPAWGLSPSEAEEATRRIVSGIRLPDPRPAHDQASHSTHDLVRSTT
jgi:alkanesulfonate monooxygenase SsuD/methylene tetrahydromethanopterin reductase-like flavin-dependent oxidoreductase (luciferase family)